MSAQHGERPRNLVVFYALFFMTVGVSLPFLPSYFRELGFTGTQAGVLLSVTPTFSLIMPPLWGQLADRSGRPGTILAICTAGGTLGCFLLTQAHSFPHALGALAVQAAFSTGVVSLADTLALHHVEHHGGNYARIRLWGSLGFVLAALPFGFFGDRLGVGAVWVLLALSASAATWVILTLAWQPARLHTGPRPTVANAVALLRHPELGLFLLATSLHWIACAPYHGSLATHVKDLELSSAVVGVCASVGVLSELVVMITWPRWSGRVTPRALLITCFVASAFRWAMMALTSNAVVIVLSALLHGLTFGAFYLAAVAWMSKRAPSSLRATGQTLFASATFGIGGIIGYRAAGWTFDQLGGHGLFGVAAILALLPAGVLALAPKPAEPVTDPAP